MNAPTIVVIGTSLGGLRALEVVLGGLPAALSVPVVVVQHRGRGLDNALAGLLSAKCALAVCEPEDKDVLCAGRVYIAPGDYHLLVEPGSVALSTEGTVQHARPSIDVLFESAADAYGAGVLGVVLTGSSDDGARGAAKIKARGGALIVQDPRTAESAIMPAAALAATAVDHVLALDDIPRYIAAACARTPDA